MVAIHYPEDLSLSLACSPLGIADTYVSRDVGAFLNFLISAHTVGDRHCSRAPQNLHPSQTVCMCMHGDEVEQRRIWHHLILMSNDVMQDSHKAIAQVLGNITYTEVVVSSAGLAALSCTDLYVLSHRYQRM